MTFPFIFFFFRLDRVRQRSEYATSEPIPANRSEGHQVCLFEDYAFLDRKNSSCEVGRIEHIILKGDHEVKDYRRPVDFEAETKKSLTLLCTYTYTKMMTKTFPTTLTKENCKKGPLKIFFLVRILP